MPVSRLGSVSTAFRTTTGTDASVTHTVTSGTTLLVVSTMYEAGETVQGTPQWSGNGTPQNLTLVDETTRSGSNADMCLSTFALVNPTPEVGGTVTVTHSSNDNYITIAINFAGTVTTSVANAIQFLQEDVNDAATSSSAFTSDGSSPNALYAVGSFKGDDGADGVPGITAPTNFTALTTNLTSGSSANSDIAAYACWQADGAPDSCTWTWDASDENAAHYLEIIADSEVIDVTGSPQLGEITSSGVTNVIHGASGTPSIDSPTATGSTLIGPLVWLNTTETTVGADQMTVTDWNHAGTSITFTDPSGGKAGSLKLGVENAAGDIGWIDVTVNTGVVTVNGTPQLGEITTATTVDLTHTSTSAVSVGEITASGTAAVRRKANAAPTLVALAASAAATLIHPVTGTPSLDEIEAVGSAQVITQASGTPSVNEIEASGVVTLTHKATATPSLVEIDAAGNTNVVGTVTASGTPSLEVITTANTVDVTHPVTGSPSLDEITSSGTTNLAYTATGSPQLDEITASGAADLTHTVTGAPSVDEITANSIANRSYAVTGSPSIIEVDAAGVAVVRHIATGAPSLAEIGATSVVNRSYSVTGTPSIAEITSSGLTTIEGTIAVSGNPELVEFTVSANALVTHDVSGTPSIAEITSTGTTLVTHYATGTPQLDEITVSSAADLTHTATSAVSIGEVTASGVADLTHDANGSPSIDEITASGITAVGGVVPVTGAVSIDELTVSGNATVTGVTVTASGTPSIPEITVSAEANRPRVWLNTTQTKSGATEMTVTAWNTAGTSITFSDPVGEPTGSLWLGVENVSSGDLGWIAVTVNAIVKTVTGTPAINEVTVSAIANVLFGNEGTPSLDEITATGNALVRHIATGTPATEEIDVVSITSVIPPQVKTAIANISLEEIEASGVVNRSYSVTGSPSVGEIVSSGLSNLGYSVTGAITLSEIESEGTVNVPTAEPSGGHFIPGLAGVKAGKKRPWEKAKEEAEEIIEDVIREVLEDDTKPVKRVSRKRKTRIIELATEEIQRQDVLLGDLRALERAVDLLSKVLLQQRRETLPEEGPRPLIIPETPLVLPDPPDQELAKLAFDMLAPEFPDDEEQELAIIIQILMSI